MANELLENARPLFAEAMAEVDNENDLTWELGWNVINTPVGAQTGFWVYTHVPAHHALGSYLQRVFMVPIGVDEAIIKRIVREQVLDLKNERRKLLSQQGNGQSPETPNQLIIPPS
jgi:hypothetical protein